MRSGSNSADHTGRFASGTISLPRSRNPGSIGSCGGHVTDQVLDDVVRIWDGRALRARVIASDELPPPPLCTTGVGFVLRDAELLLVQHVKYGWTVPGGHIEAEESPEEAMLREVWEEAAVRVRAPRVLGHQEIRPVDEVPGDYRYPIPSYQCFFAGLVESIEPFSATEEVLAVGFFAPEAAEFESWVHREGHAMAALHRRAVAISIEQG